MSEVQPPELPLNTGVEGVGGGSSENVSAQGIGYSKRQRRPSVRLGDIGDQPATLSYDTHPRRKDTGGKSSKSRPVTNLGNGDDNSNETLEIDNNNNLDLLSIRRAKRGGGGGSKRVRSNWVSKPADADAAGRDEQGFRDDGSQSPLKDHSPLHSPHSQNQQGLRIDDDGEELELDGPSEWKGGTSTDGNHKFWGLQDGVRMWLNGLGLGKYAPVFEIHEVDEDVLPQLTLDDLKDMGINAVGSRRKLYSAIQKLAKGFS
ncbi:hypothetical protein ACHQM5_007719 [Ranunculus cassubicifolius]